MSDSFPMSTFVLYSQCSDIDIMKSKSNLKIISLLHFIN